MKEQSWLSSVILFPEVVKKHSHFKRLLISSAAWLAIYYQASLGNSHTGCMKK